MEVSVKNYGVRIFEQNFCLGCLIAINALGLQVDGSLHKKTRGYIFRIFLQATAQIKNFSIKEFLNKSNQIRSFLRIWSYLLKKSLMENFIFCAVTTK